MQPDAAVHAHDHILGSADRHLRQRLTRDVLAVPIQDSSGGETGESLAWKLPDGDDRGADRCVFQRFAVVSLDLFERAILRTARTRSLISSGPACERPPAAASHRDVG